LFLLKITGKKHDTGFLK